MCQLTTIPPNEQQNMIESFWTMLQECESKAAENNDPVLRLWVEQWYSQWNRITGDSKVAKWAR